MAAFLGDIAFLFGIVVTASGLLVLHRACSDSKPKLLKVTGILLVVAGAGTAICTSYFYFKYYFAGELERPYPVHSMPMKKDMMEMRQQHMDMMMKKGGMQMNVPADIEDEDHELHLPGE